MRQILGKKVFFIHGLSGSPKKTWGNFPDYLKKLLGDEYVVDHLSYRSPPFWMFWKSAPSLIKIADARISELQELTDLEHDEIVLIGHSNGGVVIKKILQRLKLKQIENNIKKICFLDVPHNGSVYANLGKVASPRNKHLKALSINSDELYEVNDFWQSDDYYLNFETLNLIAEVDDIVSSSSAKFLYGDSHVIPNADHGSISKPESIDTPIVSKVVNFIKSASSLDKYRAPSSENYEGWLAHDNGRRHSHDLVLDDTRAENLSSLNEALAKPNSIVRLTGLSGLGKSRLIIEYINNNKDLKEENVLVFNTTRNVDKIRENVKRAIKDKAFGLVILEHCEKELHDYLAVELQRTESNLRIITVNYYNDEVDTSPQIHITKLDDESVKKLIHPLLPQFDEQELSKIVSFVEGFPLLAILLAERFRDEGILSPKLSEKDFADKLINADGNLTEEHKRILKACSLFDVFGVEQEGLEQADFIIKLAKSSRQEFGSVLCTFENHKIINRVGRFARVVPKPLAVHLASRWWDENIHDELEELISTLPDSLLGSFCTQVKYLDSSEKVKAFVARLCEPCSPFGRPELLLSTKGSRLFRGLVEVNPNATSNLIYRILNTLSDVQIKAIKHDSRRNFVWALEMLAFHKSEFDKSAWCLFKLALNENESYGNNATGQFTQLFRCYLSGTEANFHDRLQVLNRVVSVNDDPSDLLALESIKAAMDTYSSSRMVGAEYQGTRPVLKEWHPSKQSEIYNYWRSCLDIMSDLIKEGRSVGKIKNILGYEMRPLIKYSEYIPISEVVEEIIIAEGSYWPEAMQSVHDIIEHDFGALTTREVITLEKWKKLLTPEADNWDDKLKQLVLNPSNNFKKDQNDNYIDHSAEEAKSFAHQVNLDIITQHLPLLLDFPEQKQTWVFAKELAICNKNSSDFLNALFDRLKTRKREYSQFLKGYLYGVNSVSQDTWHEALKHIGNEPELQSYYCEALTTGKFDTNQLNKLIELISQNKITVSSTLSLTIGRVTDHLSESEISNFCMSLGKLKGDAIWASLDILYMYIRAKDNLDLESVKYALSFLTLNVSFAKGEKLRSHDGYGWLQSVNRLISESDPTFAGNLCDKILVQVINKDVDYSDQWDWLYPAFYEAISKHGSSIWPNVEKHLLGQTGIEKFRLDSFLRSSRHGRKVKNNIITLLPIETVMEWAEKDEALLILARTVSLFDTVNDSTKQVTPLLLSLIEKFGDKEEFLREIMANYHSRSWSGSLLPILESDLEIIKPLCLHTNRNISSWANSMCEDIAESISREQRREDESIMFRS